MELIYPVCHSPIFSHCTTDVISATHLPPRVAQPTVRTVWLQQDFYGHPRTKSIKKPAFLRVFERSEISLNLNMVPEAGLEPARPKDRQILNLLCLPISPLGRSAFTVGQ